MKIHFLTLSAFLLFCISSAAQNEPMHMHQDSTLMQKDTMNMQMPMSHSFSLNLPMNRNGSGTGWLPDESPMFAYMMHKGHWMYMLHYNIFLRYTHQDITNAGIRGGEKWDAPNWLMFMGQRKTGDRGLFHFNAMVSLDALTEGGEGYPLLFQTGESWKDKPLVDRQHPHDLFSGLSVGYSYAISKSADVFVYLGYPAEPALGSVAFMHRPSALANPDAPISHHWNDATHITFGVATLGFRYGIFKIEGSSFTGREPDENRYDFDVPRFDSWSARLSASLSRQWILQVSHGFLKSPEAMHPDENMNRTTASANYSAEFGDEKTFNSTILWGMNQMNESMENAFLAEGCFGLKRWNIYFRYEWIQKSSEELDMTENGFGPDILFPINALTIGTSFDLLHSRAANISIGGQVSAYDEDDRLNNLYGKNPLAAEVYLRISPPRLKM
jgi:hypothetical protein